MNILSLNGHFATRTSARRDMPRVAQRGANDTDFACEVSIDGHWLAISMQDAIAISPERIKRCTECGGRVRVHRRFSDGQLPRVEHLEAHSGCSLTKGFDGLRRRHRNALA